MLGRMKDGSLDIYQVGWWVTLHFPNRTVTVRCHQMPYDDVVKWAKAQADLGQLVEGLSEISRCPVCGGADEPWVIQDEVEPCAGCN